MQLQTGGKTYAALQFRDLFQFYDRTVVFAYFLRRPSSEIKLNYFEGPHPIVKLICTFSQ